MNIKSIFLISFSFILFAAAVSAQQGLPDMPLTNLHGATVSLKTAIDSNKVTIISFWATWCVPCINELDALKEKLDETKNPLFQLIAISTDEARTVQKVRPLVKSRGWNFEIYLDESNEVKRVFNVSNIPFVMIVYKGKIVYQKTGYIPGDEAVLFEKINQQIAATKL
jgi:peroxiredoxin